MSMGSDLQNLSFTESLSMRLELEKLSFMGVN